MQVMTRSSWVEVYCLQALHLPSQVEQSMDTISYADYQLAPAVLYTVFGMVI